MEELSINGCILMNNYLDENIYKNLKSSIFKILEKNNFDKIEPNLTYTFEYLRKQTKMIINKRVKSRDGDDDMIDIWHIDKGVDEKSRQYINLLNKEVEKILTNTFKIKYKLTNNNLYINRSVTETRGIHADSDKFPSRIKYFLYLTDINDIYDGPFSYIKKSHKKEGLKYWRKYDILEPLNKEDNENYIIFDKLKQNDLLIACVSGAHRGMPQKENRERIVLVGSFDPVPSSA